MIFFLGLLVLFCYTLHKMCADKGVSPWGYLISFVSGFFLIIFATAAAVVFIYGPNVAQDPDVQKKLLALTPFTLGFHFLLFYLLRRKIARIPDYHDDDDDSHLPPSDEKKDLSYFR